MNENLMTAATIGNIVALVAAVVRKGAGNDYANTIGGVAFTDTLEPLIATELSRALQTAPRKGN